MRQIVEKLEYAFPEIYKQLETLDFAQIECSPLINGAPGLGKTTACCSEEMYNLYKRKLNKTAPKVLVVESRSMTRDQKKLENSNPNIHIAQFLEVSLMVDKINDNYDIIIIDEAHSLFTDAEFAAPSTAPLANWLRDYCTIFQIYITASDVEFIKFAARYFAHKEFALTYPDLDNVYVKHHADKMILSVNCAKTKAVVEKKEKEFFAPQDSDIKRRGIFFTLSARDAYELYETYSGKGYKCGFYISRRNSTQIAQIEKNGGEEEEDLFSYTSTTYTIELPAAFLRLEKFRASNHLPSIEKSLKNGQIPYDLDYLFITDVGQEGISLCRENNLDFIFIEDTYPLKINQKLFRYRANIPMVYISLPQRRIEQILKKTQEKLLDMMTWSQEKMEGFFLAGRKSKDPWAQLIWYDTRAREYKLAENYVAYVLEASKDYRQIRGVLKDEQGLREHYGQYALEFEVEDLRANDVREKVKEVVDKFAGVELVDGRLEEFVAEVKDAGLRNKKQGMDFSFPFIKKYIEENELGKVEKKQKKTNGARKMIHKILPL